MALRRRQLAEKELTPEQRRIEQRRLTAMIDLCEPALCRRQSLLAYFGEESGPCGRCDLCRDGAALYDATIDAQKVLSAVVRTGERFGAAHLADVLIGEATDAIRRLGHDHLKTFGVGKDRSKRAWQTTIRQLLRRRRAGRGEHRARRLPPHRGRQGDPPRPRSRSSSAS